MAAMAPERSRALHNFSLPPRLSWGVQRLLRCSKVNPNTSSCDDEAAGRTTRHTDASARSHRESPYSKRKMRSDDEDNNKNYHYHNYRSSPSRSAFIGKSFRTASGGGAVVAEEESIEVVREKLMLDLHKEVDKMKVRMLSDGGGNNGIEEPVAAAAAAAATPETRPWNLRTRRAACREPMITANCGGKTLRIEEPLRTENRSPRLRNGVDEEAGVGEKRPRATIAVALSRQEIEDDFLEIQGKRPPRKPKKRPKYVQKQMDTLFPGLWLSEITPDMYKVNELVNL